MVAKPSGEVKTRIVHVPQRNGDIYEMVSQQMNTLFYQGFSEDEQKQFEAYLARILETLIENLHTEK